MANSLSLWMILIALAIIIPYSTSIGNDFALDDLVLQTADYPKQLTEIGELFQEAVVYRNMSYYRPLTFATFVVDYFIYGQRAFGYHITNLCLAVLSALLLFLWLAKLWEVKYAGLAVLTFALFSGHAEAILSIYNRSQVLSGLLISCSIYATLQSWDTPQSSIFTTRFYGGVLLSSLATLCACFAKENGLITPSLLLLVILFQPKTSKLYRKIAILLVGQILAISIYLWLRQQALGTLAVPNVDAFVESDRLWLRYVNHCYILTKYIWLILFPYSLSPDYPIASVMNHPSVWVFPIVFLFSVRLLFSQKPQFRWLGFSFFWFWFNLLPVLHLTSLQIAMAERLLYPASLSLGIWISLIFSQIIQFYSVPAPSQPSFFYYFHKLRLPVLIWSILLFSFLLSSYLITIFLYSQVWKNSEILWNYTLRKYPTESYRAFIYQGTRAGEKQDIVSMAKCYEKAILAKPNRTNTALIYQNVARVHLQQNNPEEATAVLKSVLALYPLDREANLLLGDIHLQKGEYANASEYYQKIAFPYNRWDRGYISILERIAHCSESLSVWDMAVQAYMIILERMPYHPQIYWIFYRLAVAHHYLHHPEKAQEYYQRAKRLTPLGESLPALPK